MIETRNLGKSFEDFAAVTGVDLTVGKGELLALLGPNGAGKTTTMRMLACLLRPTTGSAWIAGYSVAEQSMEVRRQVGILTEQPGLYLRMPGIDYLEFFGQLHGLDGKVTRPRALAWLERFDMADAAHRRIGEYSKGMRQKLAIIRAMLHDPPVLMMDEPTSAMDPHSAKTVRDAVSQLRDEHRTILLCTHNLAEAEALADRIAIIRRGHIIARARRRTSSASCWATRSWKPAWSSPSTASSLTWMVSSPLRNMGTTGSATARPSQEITNPVVLQRLAALGLEVVTLSQVPQSLEEVYLRVVDNPTATVES